MKLHYRLRICKSIQQSIPIIIIHGLFGNLNNLNTLAVYLNKYYHIIQVDLRNHGSSPHSSIMTYIIMAQDILNLLDSLLIKKCIIIGHSMGGKVAMTLSILIPYRIKKIIIIDIAPIKYNLNKNNKIFQAIDDINDLGIKNRHDANRIMENNLINKKIILFLLKSFRKGLWDFNFNFIKKNYDQINDWPIFGSYLGSALFIKGSLSPYITNEFINIIYQQFPKAFIETIPYSSHWVHYDNPVYLYDVIRNFIMN